MMVLLDNKGQGNIISKIIMVPITIIMIAVAFQLIDSFNLELFYALDNATAAGNNTILFPSLIKLLVGIIGMLIVVLYIKNVVDDFSEPEQRFAAR